MATIIYSDNGIKIERRVNGNIHDVADAIREILMGAGYHPDSVHDAFPDEVDSALTEEEAGADAQVECPLCESGILRFDEKQRLRCSGCGIEWVKTQSSGIDPKS